MHSIVEQTYRELMESLDRLPAKIKAEQIELTALKLDLERDEKLAKDIADTLPVRGSNEGERKANKIADLRTCEEYQRYSQAADAGRKAIAYQTDIVADIERQFNSVRYQAKLHAEYMALLANDTTAQDISFNMDVTGKSAAQVARVNGSNGTVTPEDAAQIGL